MKNKVTGKREEMKLRWGWKKTYLFMTLLRCGIRERGIGKGGAVTMKKARHAESRVCES